MLTAVRKEKALAKVSLKVPAKRVVVQATAERLAKLELARGDLSEAGGIRDLELVEASETSIEVELEAPSDAA